MILLFSPRPAHSLLQSNLYQGFPDPPFTLNLCVSFKVFLPVVKENQSRLIFALIFSLSALLQKSVIIPNGNGGSKMYGFTKIEMAVLQNKFQFFFSETNCFHEYELKSDNYVKLFRSYSKLIFSVAYSQSFRL